jgi:hypothetical protein
VFTHICIDRYKNWFGFIREIVAVYGSVTILNYHMGPENICMIVLFFNCSGRLYLDFWGSYCLHLQVELMVCMGIYIKCWRLLKYFPDIFFPNLHTSLAFNFIYSTFKPSLQGHLHYAHSFEMTQKIDHLGTDYRCLVPHLTLFWAISVRSVLMATSNPSAGQLSDLFYFRVFNHTLVQISHFPHLCCMFHSAHHFCFHHLHRILWNLQTMKPHVM